MKKLYSIAAALLMTASAQAVIHNVQVTSNVFTPSSFSANVGDTVRWTFASGTHNTTSQSVPSGAATWASPNMSSGTFDYIITTAGTYGYVCTLHSGMAGGFTASSSTGITTPSINAVLNAYPNPFKEKITVTHGSIDAIDVFNMVGEKVATMNVDAAETRTTLELAGLSSGVYFVSTMKEGAILETRRIVKTR